MPGLYVHVPFCRTKCPYCDFFSVTDLSLVGRWLEALGREAERYREDFGAFDSLYIGGGTPSLLDGPSFALLTGALRRTLSFAEGAEVTVELNPDDVTEEKVDLLRVLGVNRLSIGVQSFRDEELALLRRRHDAAGAERAVALVRRNGFRNVGLDLIYGLPGQSLADWRESLDRATALGPDHLSCYQLTLHHGTPFGRLRAEGRIRALPEEEERDFFLLTSRYLREKGFIHYEVSNFARGEDRTSRHNGKYWRHIPYLGLGPSAHSFLGGRRWWSVRSLEEYCRALEGGVFPVEDGEFLSSGQLRLERLFLGFRTMEGVSVDDVLEGDPSGGTMEAMVSRGLVVRRGDRLIPTEKGLLLADRLPLIADDRLS